MKVFMKLWRARGARPTGMLFVLSAVLIASVFGAAAPKGKNMTEAERAARRKAIIAPVAEGVLRARPTFAACGVCYGSAAAVPGLALEWRKLGAGAWQTLREFPHFDETGDYRGSILRLEEDTAYEVRVVADGAVRAQTPFRTWASEVPVARTVWLDADTTFPVKVGDRGKPDGWVRYTAKPGVVIDNRTEQELCFQVEGASYVLFDNLTIRGSGARHVMTIEKSSCVRVRNCDIARWGRVGTPRFDMLGRRHEVGKPARGYGINMDGAIKIGRGSQEVVVERCFIHDPRGQANSWFYSHPAGPEAVVLQSPDHSTVIRWNDFVGSDAHRWNDAVESIGNFSADGGFNRDADVYGNFMAICNDDCIELDGGQQNVRCWDNRFEEALCGVSVQGCMVSPVYVHDNGFYSMGDEFGLSGQTIKTGGGDHGAEAWAYMYGNLLWGAGTGITRMQLLRLQTRGNTFCGTQKIRGREISPFATSVDDTFGAEIAEKDLPVKWPARPAGFQLDRARFSDIQVAKGQATPANVHVTATGGARDVPFAIAKCDVFDWFDVAPAKGVIPAGGQVTFTVTFRPERMADRHDYRGAFLVRTPEGLSRPVSLYAETDFVPPYKAAREGDFALYADGLCEGDFKTFDRKKETAFTFDVPKAGRYYLMVHAKGEGRDRLRVAVDGEQAAESIQQTKPYPTWTMLTPGHKFGDMTCHWDLQPGPHTVRIRATAYGKLQFDGLVLTDNPGSFEPR